MADRATKQATLENPFVGAPVSQLELTQYEPHYNLEDNQRAMDWGLILKIKLENGK